MTLARFEYLPARDLGLTLLQRLRSPAREPDLFETAIHWTWWTAVRAYLRVFHRLSIGGLENLPARPPFILAANHTSHLDALVLASGIRRRDRDRAHPLAAEDTFFERPFRAFFAAAFVNALPVMRGAPRRHDWERLRSRLLEERCVYVVFPEGTRSRTGRLGAFRAGIGMLAAGTPVPVVPCHVSGAFEAWPSGRRLPRPRKITLRIGRPLVFAGESDRKSGWLRVAERCREAVATLSPRSRDRSPE